ncbi:hypothetical protein B0A89_07840 [Paracoccus contaminans]|uniref:Diguanylate cyclase n=2 Tax=Paracoccus contaminans TaxID=1945662 RepID=A0A1W6CXG4_9RHOB|nr:hypothetical protein B0A89_07840 [Paracoccus contaminans]
MTTHWPNPSSPDIDFESDAGMAKTGDEFRGRLRERYRAVVRAGALVLWRADDTGQMTGITGWEQLTGRPADEAIGRGYVAAFHPDDQMLLDFRNQAMGDSLQIECRVLDRDRRWRWVRGRGVRLSERSSFAAEWVGTLEDIHDQRRALDRARYLAERDALTGLGNRRTLSAYLTRLRDRQASATVVMLDVDGFKAINDLHGHQVGDRFLVRLGQMLVAAAPAHSLCARMGGDEFCVAVADGDEARAMCAALAGASTAGIAIGDLLVPLSFSAGIADADWDDPDPGSMVLRKADLALRRAKAQSGGIVVHNARMQAESDRRELLLRAIAPACRNDEFFLEYQPIVDVDSGAQVSVEALIRWQHPQFGRIGPSTFVHLAEQNGLIAELGRWVLRRACADMAGTAPDIRVNLNVSARQLAAPDFADDVLAIAREYAIAPQRITLELTESVNMAVLAGSDAFARLRQHGFRTVLDDFGTEYAMLSHITSGQFDGIKLSRDLVRHCCVNERAGVMLRHLVGLSEGLGMEIVAEGVETPGELACLKQHGIRLMQGYYFGRPRALHELGTGAPAAG